MFAVAQAGELEDHGAVTRDPLDQRGPVVHPHLDSEGEDVAVGDRDLHVGQAVDAAFLDLVDLGSLDARRRCAVLAEQHQGSVGLDGSRLFVAGLGAPVDPLADAAAAGVVVGLGLNRQVVDHGGHRCVDASKVVVVGRGSRCGHQARCQQTADSEYPETGN